MSSYNAHNVVVIAPVLSPTTVFELDGDTPQAMSQVELYCHSGATTYWRVYTDGLADGGEITLAVGDSVIIDARALGGEAITRITVHNRNTFPPSSVGWRRLG
jgi:hypothetical protein